MAVFHGYQHTVTRTNMNMLRMSVHWIFLLFFLFLKLCSDSLLTPGVIKVLRHLLFYLYCNEPEVVHFYKKISLYSSYSV